MKNRVFRRYIFYLALVVSFAGLGSCELLGNVDSDGSASGDPNPTAYQALYGNWSVTMMGTSVTYSFFKEGYTTSPGGGTYLIATSIEVGTDEEGRTTISFGTLKSDAASGTNPTRRVITMVDANTFTMPIAMGGPPTIHTFTRRP